MIKIIINPIAGGSKTSTLWPDIERRIKKLRIEYHSVFTQGVGHATELAKAAIKEGFKKIFVVGGDGTLNEVINGIDLNQTTVGIIPTGSGNDLAKMIGLKDINDGLVSFQHQNKRSIDLGKMRGRYFVNNLGIGFDAQVAKRAQILKVSRGGMDYLVSVLSILYGFKAFQIEVVADGYRFCGKIMSLCMGNGQSHGGMFLLTPQAIIDDGLLDICIIQELSKTKFLLNIPKAIKGTHGCLREVKMFKTNKIIVRSDKNLFVHLDGEVLLEPIKEIEAEVLPRSLEVFSLSREGF